MTTFDRHLIDPSPHELLAALLQAVEAANDGLTDGRVVTGSATWDEFFALVQDNVEGLREWAGGKRRWPTTKVSAFWWTDPVGRRHYRVVGGACRIEQGERIGW